MALLVTGGAGFVGLNVVQSLLEREYDVVLFDAGKLPPGAGRAFEAHRSKLSIEQGVFSMAKASTASVPTSLYSITKHAAERMCLRLRDLWNIDVVCVRLGTVIGPWERDTGVRDNFGTHSQLGQPRRRGQDCDIDRTGNSA